jgi:hypothetical protein
MRVFKVGEKVWLRQPFGWHNWKYVKGIVSKITPSGLTDVTLDINPSFSTRFVPSEVGDWRVHGERWHSSYYLDCEMSFTEREEFVQKQEKAWAANRILQEAKELFRNQDATYDNAEEMLKVVTQVREKLVKAEELLLEASTTPSPSPKDSQFAEVGE